MILMGSPAWCVLSKRLIELRGRVLSAPNLPTSYKRVSRKQADLLFSGLNRASCCPIPSFLCRGRRCRKSCVALLGRCWRRTVTKALPESERHQCERDEHHLR